MLQQTFIHFSGIGLARERRLWQDGIRTWQDCLASGAEPAGLVPGARLREQAQESCRAYRGADWAFFDRRLPSDHKWRAFGDFRDRTLYLDIETTGLTWDDPITVIGLYNGRETKTFILGQNLRDAVDEISRYPILVTYNGACFDVPIIRRQFASACRNQIHIDLRYPLRRLGYSGGLKGIEQAMGIARSEATRGLGGWDAVRLWQAYLGGSREALDLLVAYNAEDVRNLKPLMEFVYQAFYSKLHNPN